MARDHEEFSTNQAGYRRGTPPKTPTASNLVAAMTVEELKLYNQISAEISPETLDVTATPIVGEAGNVIYFTHEKFVVGLRLPIPSLVKKFLHFT